MDLNEITVTGYVANDYNVKEFDKGPNEKGYKVLNGTIISNESNDITTPHNFTIWDKRADAIEKNTGKGSRLLVKGPLRRKVNEKDGQKYVNYYIDARQIIFLDSISNKDGSNSNQKGNTSSPFDNAKIPENNPSVFDDELPF